MRRLRSGGVLLLLLFLGGVTLSQTTPAEWPGWRGPGRDGLNHQTDWRSDWPKEGPARLWTAQVGIGFSSCAVAAGRLVTMGHAGGDDGADTVWCLDALTGGEKWHYSYSCPLWNREHEGGPASTPTIDGERVYTLSREGHLFCFQLSNGTILWQRNLRADYQVPPRASEPPRDYGLTGSPLVLGDRLFVEVGGKDSSLVALDKLSGKLIWGEGNDGAGYGTPVAFHLAGRQLLATFNLTSLAINDQRNGARLGQFPWKTKIGLNAATPLVFDGKVFISSYGMGCALLDLKKGVTSQESGVSREQKTAFPTRNSQTEICNDPNMSIIWQNKELNSEFAAPVFWQGYIYGFDYVKLACLDARDGKVMWKQDGFGRGSVQIAGGKLLIGGENGELAVAQATAGGYREICRAKLLPGKVWTIPVLNHGLIYVRNGAGELSCLDVRVQK